MAAHDQTFSAYGATLLTGAAPYDPSSGVGDPDDPAYYVAQPGVNFLRPWIAVRNGPAFLFPGGMEGFNVNIDPTLGIHKYIGDNKCVVDVIHAGEEHIVLTGAFIGDSSPKLFQALRQVVYQGAGDEGKIMYVPEIMSHAQRVEVVHFSTDRDTQSRGRDMTYTLEVVRKGTIGDVITAKALREPTQAVGTKRGTPTRVVSVDAKHNTLRKIAQWKLGDSNKWQQLFNANEAFFVKNHIITAKAPTYRMPIGTKIAY